MTLRDDLPLALDWDKLRIQEPDAEALRALCTECGFHRFRDELTTIFAPPAAQNPDWQASYQTVDTPESLERFLDELGRQPRFCVDTETTGLDPLRADLVGLAFCWKAGEAYYLPLRGPLWSKVLDPVVTLASLRPVLADPQIEKIGQNVKYDMLAPSARDWSWPARSPTRCSSVTCSKAVSATITWISSRNDCSTTR